MATYGNWWQLMATDGNFWQLLALVSVAIALPFFSFSFFFSLCRTSGVSPVIFIWHLSITGCQAVQWLQAMGLPLHNRASFLKRLIDVVGSWGLLPHILGGDQSWRHLDTILSIAFLPQFVTWWGLARFAFFLLGQSGIQISHKMIQILLFLPNIILTWQTISCHPPLLIKWWEAAGVELHFEKKSVDWVNSIFPRE